MSSVLNELEIPGPSRPVRLYNEPRPEFCEKMNKGRSAADELSPKLLQRTREPRRDDSWSKGTRLGSKQCNSIIDFIRRACSAHSPIFAPTSKTMRAFVKALRKTCSSP